MFQESLSSNAPSLESSLADAASATATSDQLKCHTLYHLHVCLRNGRELVARDSGKVIHPKHYQHLKKGAHQSHLGRQEMGWILAD